MADETVGGGNVEGDGGAGSGQLVRCRHPIHLFTVLFQTLQLACTRNRQMWVGETSTRLDHHDHVDVICYCIPGMVPQESSSEFPYSCQGTVSLRAVVEGKQATSKDALQWLW